MNIAYTSDLHVDVNKEYKLTDKLIKYLKNYNCTNIIIAGDISSHYDTTISVINKFKRNGINAWFVSGNHDIYTSSDYTNSYEIYRKYCEHPLCLSGNYFETDESIIVGDVGWYDFSFADRLKYSTQQIEFKDGWMDKWRINFDDIEFCNYQNKKFTSRLQYAKETGKDIIIVSHMVPSLAHCRRYPNSYYDAYTGNQQLWEIVKEYGVKTWIYGHNHLTDDRLLDKINTLASPINYNHEWNGRSVDEQIEFAVKFIDV